MKYLLLIPNQIQVAPTIHICRVMAGDLESVVRAWTAAYTEEVAEFAPPDQVLVNIRQAALP